MPLFDDLLNSESELESLELDKPDEIVDGDEDEIFLNDDDTCDIPDPFIYE